MSNFEFIKNKYEGQLIKALRGPLSFFDNPIFLFAEINRSKCEFDDCEICYIDLECKKRYIESNCNIEIWEKFFKIL